MKVSDLTRPPEGHKTPKVQHEQKSVILTDRINDNLCKQRESLEAIVPLMETMVQQNATAIEAILKLSDRLAEVMAHNETLLEAANENTKKIVEAVKK